VALLDDLDSELDDARAGALCRVLAQHGQALVTTAHEPWARRIASDARTFQVADGRFTPA
jgi:recombinational DNA repair ATPase RecF